MIDLESGDVRYCVYKRIGPEGDDRLERQRRFLTEHVDTSLQAGYFGDPRKTYLHSISKKDEDVKEEDREETVGEPFALLHRSYDPKEVL